MKSLPRIRLTVLEGEGGQAWLSDLAGVDHLPWSSGLELQRDGWYVLNGSGASLQMMLGPCFRQRCSFALPGLESLAEEDIPRLARTATKRKSRSVMLGTWRLLPMVCAAKELASGGCLGELQSIGVGVGSGYLGGWRDDLLCRDLMQWLGEGVATLSPLAAEGSVLRLDVLGTHGHVTGACGWDGKGSLRSTVGGHVRHREFGVADVRLMELGVLSCLGGLSGDLPALLTCKGLSRYCSGVSEEKVSITDRLV